MSHTRHAHIELRESNPNASGRHGLSGDLGVSSERLGRMGPDGAWGTDGIRPTSPPPLPEDPAPEAQPGNPEENPIGLPPKEHDLTRNPGHSHG